MNYYNVMQKQQENIGRKMNVDIDLDLNWANLNNLFIFNY